MADSFSLPNAAELVEKLRMFGLPLHGEEVSILRQAADAIEQFGKDIDVLTKENAKLKAERDAAVADLRYSRVCFTCKYISDPDCDGCHANMNRWEWRGVTDTNVCSKEEEDADDRR